MLLMVLLIGFLSLSVGATGIFAFVLCPSCTMYTMPKQLPEELEKETAKDTPATTGTAR
jgi:hypothetical protein